MSSHIRSLKDEVSSASSVESAFVQVGDQPASNISLSPQANRFTTVDCARQACQLIYKNWGSVTPLIRDWEMDQARLVTTPDFCAVSSTTTSECDEFTQGFWKQRAESILEFEDAVQNLHSLLKLGKDFVLLNAMLAEYGLCWTDVPLRYTEGELNKKYTHWIESTKDAMDTSLFSSAGIWTSPNWANEVAFHSVSWLLVGSAAIIAGFLQGSVWPPEIGSVIDSVVREPISMVALGIAFAISGLNDFCMWVCLSKFSALELAKRLMVLQAAITLSAGVFFTVASSCNGTMSKYTLARFGVLTLTCLKKYIFVCLRDKVASAGASSRTKGYGERYFILPTESREESAPIC